MKKYIYMAVAAIAVLSSCTSDNEVAGNLTPKGGEATFTATIEAGSTRTTLGTGDDAGKVFWEVNDAICVNGVNLTTTGPTGENHTQATFTSSGSVTANETSPSYKAYYPADLYSGSTATLPALQTYDATTNGISNLPMYAESNDHNLVFKILCCVLKITVNSSDFSEVSSINVYSNTWMNGEFTVDASNNYSMSFSGDIADANKKVTLSMGTTPVSITTSQVFYIAIPAGTHNLIIKVNGNSTSKVMATKAAAGINVERNTIYPITFAENAIRLWANGPYWATVNVGATITDYDQLDATAEADNRYGSTTTNYTTANVGGLYCWGGKTFRNFRVGTYSASQGSDNDYYISSSIGNIANTERDIAKSLWGVNWCMPTKDDLNNLISSTKCTWSSSSITKGTTGNTIICRSVSGKNSYSSNVIFLPIAGFVSSGTIENVATYGRYWSSTPKSSSDAYYLSFTKNSQSIESQNGSPSRGYTVRAVLNVTNL